MFEEQDYIVVTLGDDSADSEDTSHSSDYDDSSDVVIIEDSDSELSENGLPMDSASTDQPSFQGRADNHQQLSQMPPGAEVLPSQGDQGVSQVSFPRSFKSYRSGPGDMEPVPGPNTRGSSPPRENNMCLQELIQNSSQQISYVSGVFSSTGQFLQKSLVPGCGDVGAAAPVVVEETLAKHHPGGTPETPAEFPEVWQLDLSESLSFPSIFSTYSQPPDITGGSPFHGLYVGPLYFNGVAENNEGAAENVPVALMWEGAPGLGNAPEEVNYPADLGDYNMCPDSAYSSVCIPPNFAIEKLLLLEIPENTETSVENHSQRVYYTALLGNFSGQDTDSSPFSRPPNFAPEKITLIEMLENAGTSMENSSQTMYNAIVVASFRGPRTQIPASSADSIPTNAADEEFTEVPENLRTCEENSFWKMYNATLLASNSGPGAQMPSSSADSTPPNVGHSYLVLNSQLRVFSVHEKVMFIKMPVNARTSVENSIWKMYKNAAALAKDCHPEAQMPASSADSTPPNVDEEDVRLTEMPVRAGTSMGNSIHTMCNLIVVGNDSGPQAQMPASTSDFIPLNAADEEDVRLTEMPVGAGTSMGNSIHTMCNLIVVGNDSGPLAQMPASTSDFIPLNAPDEEDVRLTEMPVGAGTSMGNSIDTMCNLIVVGNDSDPLTQMPASTSDFIPLNAADEEDLRLTEMPVGAGTSMGNSIHTMCNLIVVGNDSGPLAQMPASTSDFIALNAPDEEDVRLTEMPVGAGTSMGNSIHTMYNLIVVGNDSGPQAQMPASTSDFILLNAPDEEDVRLTEMPVGAGTSMGNSIHTMYNLIVVGNDSGPQAQMPASTSDFILLNAPDEEDVRLTEMPVGGGTSMGNSIHTMCNLIVVGNDSGPLAQMPASTSDFIPPNAADEEDVRLTEMPVGAGTSMGNSIHTMYNLIVVGNDSGPLAQMPASTSDFIPPNAEMLVEGEISRENNIEMMNYLSFLKNDSRQETSTYAFIPCDYGYLGDPERNVRILHTHLRTAQQMPDPRSAACYLVRMLFSEETLIGSWIGVNSQCRQPLDKNKMDAIREYLATVFPNYDLHECGLTWKLCTTDINSVISSLYLKARGTPVTTDNSNTNLNTPTSVASNVKMAGNHRRGIFYLRQQTTASGIRANGDCRVEIKGASNDNSTASSEEMVYIGDPSRNVKVPYLVMLHAKAKSRPQLSATYLVRKLFPMDVLLKSNVHGSVSRQLYALNPNCICAIREFLQGVFLSCDLSQDGLEWHSCVRSINNCVRSLRYNLKKVGSKSSREPPEKTPSTESKTENTEATD